MDPTPEERQNDQPQQKQSKEGAVGQGISAINNFVRARRGFTNPLGKVGSRAVTQVVLRGFTAFLAGAWFPVALTLGLVLLFTVIIIMGFGGAPPSETGVQTPQALPTLVSTPTPAP